MELDDAYANMAYIPAGADYPDRWAAQAAAFRSSQRCEVDLIYGENTRQLTDHAERCQGKCPVVGPLPRSDNISHQFAKRA